MKNKQESCQLTCFHFLRIAFTLFGGNLSNTCTLEKFEPLGRLLVFYSLGFCFHFGKYDVDVGRGDFFVEHFAVSAQLRKLGTVHQRSCILLTEHAERLENLIHGGSSFARLSVPEKCSMTQSLTFHTVCSNHQRSF